MARMRPVAATTFPNLPRTITITIIRPITTILITRVIGTPRTITEDRE